MNVMRVDNTNNPPHDHGFGTGVGEAEAHQVGIGLGEEHGAAGESHGLFDHVADVHHVEVGHFDQDFGQHHDGLHGLHDSIGLGFGGEEHSIHDAGLHDNHHVPVHEPVHDPALDQHHSLGDIGHHG